MTLRYKYSKMLRIVGYSKKRKMDILAGMFLIIFSLTHDLVTSGFTIPVFGRFDLLLCVIGMLLICIGHDRIRGNRLLWITLSFMFFAMIVTYVVKIAFPDMPIVYSLQVLVAKTSSLLINLIGIRSESSDAGIRIYNGEDTHNFHIDPGCAGTHSLTAFVIVYLIALADIKKFKKGNAIIFFIGGVLMMFLFNICRIAVIGIMAYRYDSKTALFVHDWIAWLPFILLIILFWYFVLPVLRVDESKDNDD